LLPLIFIYAYDSLAMYTDLGTFFQETQGGRNIPSHLRPGFAKHLSQSLLGHGGKLIAQGNLDDGSFFQISQHKPDGTMWMEIFRPDGTLQEQHRYEPAAKAYALHISNFSVNGKQLLNHKVYTRDGRLIEEINRNDKHQLDKISCTFPDIRGITSVERNKFAHEFRCCSTIERQYRDISGSAIAHEELLDANRQLVKESIYDDDGKHVIGTVLFHPGTQINATSLTYDKNGIRNSQTSYSKTGQILHHNTYYTDHAKNESETTLKVKAVYRNGLPHVEIHYRNDASLEARKEYEADGKTLKSEIIYDSKGEYATEIRQYKKGNLYKKSLTELQENETQKERIILYNENGRPYRSREHYFHDNGNEFWAETDINPETYNISSSLVDGSKGLFRKTYHPKTGRLHQMDMYREAYADETLRRRIHYYPPDARGEEGKHIRRVEAFDTDGETLHEAQNYYVDGSIRAADYTGTNGAWVHRVYPKGTEEIDENTPHLYESTYREDGTREHSTLHAHPDPSIRSLKKSYDGQGKPLSVLIDSINGMEHLSWEEYTQRRKHERTHNTMGPISLVTITPEIITDNNGQTHNGRTSITLQGSTDDLQKAMARLKRHIPEIQCELHLGKNGIIQLRGQPGSYKKETAAMTGNELFERVNVLNITIPYNRYENESWPRHYDTYDIMSNKARYDREWGISEATEALNNIMRCVKCDMGLNITPAFSTRTNNKNQQEYFPYIVMRWPNKPYLPEAQNEVMYNYLSDQMALRNFDCNRIPGQNGMDVLIAPKALPQNTATRIANHTAKELMSAFTPSSVRTSEPEAQL
jgi:hypothetical protein